MTLYKILRKLNKSSKEIKKKTKFRKKFIMFFEENLYMKKI